MTRSYGQPNILAVDDEAHVLEALSTILEARGYRVRCVPNGAMALDEIAAERPDVVLLDLAMPGLDGVEVCHRVRSYSRVPILVLSALSDEPRKVRALDAGADDYVTKPFGVEELLARIRAAIRRGQAQRDDEAVLQVSGIEIDQIAHRVRVDGDEVHLTPTQYELLRFLASNPDRVLTQRAILVGVFGPTYADAVDNLRTFVAQLRRKVERDPARPQRIVTEPGLGYRFRSEAAPANATETSIPAASQPG
jgi:two-component system, OmpR family, KDP operon response regulator KdpE